MSTAGSKKIAVVGGGISGLVAAYVLSRRYDVRLFEGAPHLGGHTCTVPVVEGERKLWIDMGFIVFNDRTYPNFIRLLDELGVESQASSMSFSVRCERTGLEYNGSSLNQLFAQRSNFLRLSFYRMILGILRFHRMAPRLLQSGDNSTLGTYLNKERFSGPFVDHYLVPMIAAIWSTRPESMFDFPVRTLASFLNNHGMLSIQNRPQWRVVRGGSRCYVDALVRSVGDRIAASTPIDWVKRGNSGAQVKPCGEPAQHFDEVVIATHSDQALKLLADANELERSVLGAIPYQKSEVVLHTDTSFLPRRRRARASWNYHLNTPNPGGVQVTYSMNHLQNLDAERHYLVTLNRTAEIDPGQILQRKVFAHPLYTPAGIEAQARWSEISGTNHTHFCGAYWGHGFHEDGVVSALEVAAVLGVAPPWNREEGDEAHA